ncbi:mechanosensitive ion channel domain-containing protein [Microvirga sp. CF3062]|uniref:mechanosensitive ion channel family protein n=1 Tax=Microvirga sp. CF3062 TaxID=3110182 RepID=UPI002E7A9ACA|nr:mechanosensitive ion channel domain-containing protein [Microvirga sp. CF3062]MEE1657171.1 mechanosensitive ion channel domain-containing protein [Microvirga sp. CF3062]
MMISLRQALREMAIPLVGALLLVLFIVLQALGTPQALGGLGFLSPAQTSSPRATLESFRADASRATALLMEAYRESRSEPGLSWSESVTRKVEEADALLARAAQTLDLRDIPPVELEHRRLESVILLKEILDRVPLPDPGIIPGDDEVAGKPPASWNVPGTDLRIAHIADGARTGEYLFSSGTVLGLESFYRLIRNKPNLSGAQADFYDFFSQSPGHLLPPKWFSVIEALPTSLRVEIEGQAVWQWIAFFLVTGLAVGAVLAVRSLARNAAASQSGAVQVLTNVIVPGAVAVAALFVRYMSDNQINLTGRINSLVEEIAEVIAYIAMIWAVLAFSNAVAGRLYLSATKSIDAHLARATVRIAGLAVAIALLIYGASHLGIPLAGLLAGLGVGGLAVALAAKPTLENFIGGLILYADRPVRVGDLCRFGTLEGRVEEIGIRSTRIRGLDRTLITIPNATFVNMNIINLTNRDRMPYDRVMGLAATDTAAIRQEIETVAALVADHPKIERGSVQARLREGHEEKPKVEICALIATSKWSEFLQIQQELDLMLRDKMLSSAPADEAVPSATDNVVPLKDPA